MGREARGCAGYPPLLERLGADAPDGVDLYGNPALLRAPITGLFCSVRVPGRAIVDSYSVARGLAAGRATVAGGFHSPLEREALDYLLRGTGRAIICPARGLHRLRIPRLWRAPISAGRLLLLSPFPAQIRRATSDTAERRNRVVAALSSRLIFLHAAPGGGLARLAQEAAARGTPIHCLDHPANEDLRVLGAVPLSRTPLIDG